MRKICIVTGTRAEWGLLSRLARLIKDDSDLELSIIATNTHLSPEFGLTYREIENEGFQIDKKVESLLSSDTPNGTAKSVGMGVIGLADAYEDLQPDILIILGDRFEMLAAVTAALFNKIPVAHIHGGEITMGAYDDQIRHSITKMSHLHFTAAEDYKKRVIQLGENPEHVFNVGAIGLDNIAHMKLLDKRDLEKSISFNLGNKSMLVTFHPETLNTEDASVQIDSLLKAISKYDDYKLLFTLPNSDTRNGVIKTRIEEFVSAYPHKSITFSSLGHLRYLSALEHVSMVVGNSSSGIIEAPFFKKPTINIGHRQEGRLKAASVIDCLTDTESIINAIDKAILFDLEKINNVINPYYLPDTAANILNTIKNANLENIVKKKFYNLAV